MFVQNSFKYALTQGDGLLIAALASLSDQGAYALASNYGGLIARMLFQPIEETSRNIFAQLCSSSGNESATRTRGKSQANNHAVSQARDLLQNILHLYSLIALVAVSVAPTLAPIFLQLAAGSRWSETQAPAVLVAYCYYIPLLAINGITEAFVAATASEAKLYMQSAMMGIWFGAYVVATYVFVKALDLGAVGLVWSNCLNMGLRILFNGWFISGEFRERNSVRFIHLYSRFANLSSILI
jgi:oligosaccharide translocation protein RFT1